MRRFCALLLTVLFAAEPFLLAQQSPAPQAAPAVMAVTPPGPGVAVKHTPDGKPILEDSTPVRLRTKRNLSSKDCKTGDQVDFEVLDPVVLDGITVIPQGGIAMGKVTEAEHKKSMGRAGKLDIVIESVKMTNGEKAALRAVKDTKGGGHVGAMTGAIVATSIVFFPAAPLFLFVHGKDITIPSGTEITAYVNGDTVFTPLAPPPSAAAAAAVTNVPADAELILASSIDGADIEIDGAFVGNTPSTVQVSTGDHTVRISREGYQSYEKRIHVSGGKISLRAELEPVKE